MLHFHNGNPHEVMRTANCKSMINELSLIWHNFPLTAQLFNEMTHLILSFLFMIHILTVRSLNFFICFFRFANYLQQNNFLSREKHFSEEENELFMTSRVAEKINFLLRYVTDIRYPIYYSQKGFLFNPIPDSRLLSEEEKSFCCCWWRIPNSVYALFYSDMSSDWTKKKKRYALPDTLSTTKAATKLLRRKTSHNKLLRSGSAIVSLRNQTPRGTFFPKFRSIFLFYNFYARSTTHPKASEMNENTSSSTLRHWISRRFYRISLLYTQPTPRGGENNIYRILNTCKERGDIISSASSSVASRNSNECKCSSLFLWSENTFNPSVHIGSIWWEFIERAMCFSALTLYCANHIFQLQSRLELALIRRFLFN